MSDPPPPRRTLRILLVGEGNLSFTHALVKRLSASLFFARWRDVGTESDRDPNSPPPPATVTQCAVVATTFDEEPEQIARYPESGPILAYFASKSRVPVRYQGGVNATDIVATLAAGGGGGFDPALIVFNNPHIGFEDLYRQRSLVSHFFAAVRELSFGAGGRDAALARHGHQVVVSLCDDQPRRWSLLDAAARSGFVCVAAVPLVGGDFPEYENKRHQSDARFPYRVMVQYYFADATRPGVREMARGALSDICAEWPLRLQSAEASHVPPCRVDTLAWLSALQLKLEGADALPVAEASPPAATSLPVLHTELARLCESGIDAARVCQYSLGGLDINCCAPLVHPDLFYSSSGSLFISAEGGADADGTARAEGRQRNLARNHFSPFLDVRVLPQLLRLQAEVELVAKGHAPAVEAAVNIPGTLDPKVLGRPLTQREGVKLARFLEKAAVGKAPRKPQSGREQQPLIQLTCPYCAAEEVEDAEQAEPDRIFRTQSGYDHHLLTKHSGVEQLHPNMHARVHKQIVRDSCAHKSTPDDLEARLSGLNIIASDRGDTRERYCGVCDLLFVSVETYREHLAFLSPTATTFTCTECPKARYFLDARALHQHKTLKHRAGAVPALPREDASL